MKLCFGEIAMLATNDKLTLLKCLNCLLLQMFSNDYVYFSVSGCDDETWIEVQKRYDACIEEKSQELSKLGEEQKGDRISLESCR